MEKSFTQTQIIYTDDGSSLKSGFTKKSSTQTNPLPEIPPHVLLKANKRTFEIG